MEEKKKGIIQAATRALHTCLAFINDLNFLVENILSWPFRERDSFILEPFFSIIILTMVYIPGLYPFLTKNSRAF